MSDAIPAAFGALHDRMLVVGFWKGSLMVEIGARASIGMAFRRITLGCGSAE